VLTFKVLILQAMHGSSRSYPSVGLRFQQVEVLCNEYDDVGRSEVYLMTRYFFAAFFRGTGAGFGRHMG
jgi:hypothetical protein